MMQCTTLARFEYDNYFCFNLPPQMLFFQIITQNWFMSNPLCSLKQLKDVKKWRNIKICLSFLPKFTEKEELWSTHIRKEREWCVQCNYMCKTITAWCLNITLWYFTDVPCDGNKSWLYFTFLPWLHTSLNFFLFLWIAHGKKRREITWRT